MFAVLAVLLLGLQGAFCQYGPEEKEIISIPGFEGELPSPQYSGYIQVPNTDKRLFYILVVSQDNPEDNPLTLWINGGPGCSSIGGGYVEENGPFIYMPTPVGDGGLLYNNVTLQENPYSWSKVSNMLYIDSPAGVGLSYSTDPSDYVTDDYQTAQDLYEGLLTWFEEYTFFANHTFIMSGESYAGVYIPLTASLILDGVASGTQPLINLAAYAIGNPSTTSDDNYNMNGVYKGFNLISQETDSMLKDADCPQTEDYNEEDYADSENDMTTCTNLRGDIHEDTDSVFGYDINKSCFYGVQTFNRVLFDQIKERLASDGIQWEDDLSEYQVADDYCDYDDRVAQWLLNAQNVRDAIHAAPFADATQTLAGFFETCTNRLNFTSLVNDTVDYHSSNIAQGVEVLIYSGDHDLVVPTEGTQKWTSQLGEELGVLQPWSPWFIELPEYFGYQIAGYITQYEGLTFLTIRSAGHQVPTTYPREALAFFSSWLQGSLNDTTVPPTNFGTADSLSMDGIQVYA